MTWLDCREKSRAGELEKARMEKVGDGSIKLRPHRWEPQTGRGWKVVLEKYSPVQFGAHCVMYAMHWQGSSEVEAVMGWSRGGREGVVKGAVGWRSALRKDPQLGQPENPPHWLKSLMQSTERCSVQIFLLK